MEVLMREITLHPIYNKLTFVCAIMILVLGVSIQIRVICYDLYSEDYTKFTLVITYLMMIVSLFIFIPYLINKGIYTNPLNDASFTLSKNKRFVVIDEYGLVKPKLDVVGDLNKELYNKKDKIVEYKYTLLENTSNPLYMSGKNISGDDVIVTKGSDEKYYISFSKDNISRTIYEKPIKLDNGTVLNGYIGTKLIKDANDNIIKMRYSNKYDVYYDIEMGIKH